VYDHDRRSGTVCVAITPDCDPETGYHCKTKCKVQGQVSNFCAEVDFFYVAPLQAGVGEAILLEGNASDPEGDSVSYSWTASEGEVQDPEAEKTSYICVIPGMVELTLTLNAGTPCKSSDVVQVSCVAPALTPQVDSSPSEQGPPSPGG
jgi:hypothetical protein